jgi:hypothetical protein
MDISCPVSSYLFYKTISPVIIMIYDALSISDVSIIVICVFKTIVSMIFMKLLRTIYFNSCADFLNKSKVYRQIETIMQCSLSIIILNISIKVNDFLLIILPILELLVHIFLLFHRWQDNDGDCCETGSWNIWCFILTQTIIPLSMYLVVSIDSHNLANELICSFKLIILLIYSYIVSDVKFTNWPDYINQIKIYQIIFHTFQFSLSTTIVIMSILTFTINLHYIISTIGMIDIIFILTISIILSHCHKNNTKIIKLIKFEIGLIEPLISDNKNYVSVSQSNVVIEIGKS